MHQCWRISHSSFGQNQELQEQAKHELRRPWHQYMEPGEVSNMIQRMLMATLKFFFRKTGTDIIPKKQTTYNDFEKIGSHRLHVYVRAHNHFPEDVKNHIVMFIKGAAGKDSLAII